MFHLTNYQVKEDIRRNNMASQDKVMTTQQSIAHQYIHNSLLKQPIINTAMPQARRPRRPPAHTPSRDIHTLVHSLDRFLPTLVDY